MPADYDPPPPPIGAIPDTGQHGAAIADHEKRLRANEKCSRDTLELARSTQTAVGLTQESLDKLGRSASKGLGLALTLLLAVVGSVGTFVITTIQTTGSVERLEAGAAKADTDRAKLHEAIHGVRDTVTATRRDVAADRRADDAVHMHTTMRLDALGMRRGR